MNAELLDRLPPSDARVEMGLLGAIALKPRVLDDVAEIIQPDDFYADANRRLYLAFQAMHAARVPFGNIAVASDWLKKSGEYEVIGGAVYLAECLTSEPTAAHAVYYAGIIARHAKMRAIIHAATEALRDAYDPTATPVGVIDTAGRAFAEVAPRDLRTAMPVVVVRVGGRDRCVVVDDRGDRVPNRTPTPRRPLRDLHVLVHLSERWRQKVPRDPELAQRVVRQHVRPADEIAARREPSVPLPCDLDATGVDACEPDDLGLLG